MGKNKKKDITMMMPEKTVFLSLLFSVHFFFVMDACSLYFQL